MAFYTFYSKATWAQPTKLQPLEYEECGIHPTFCFPLLILSCMNTCLPHSRGSDNLPQCTLSSVRIYLVPEHLGHEQYRLWLRGMFFKAPVGTIHTWNLSKEIPHTPPTSSRLRSFPGRMPALTGRLPNGSLCCIHNVEPLKAHSIT